MRVAVVAGAVVAAVFVAVNVTSTGNGSEAVSPAQAQILRHIRDALVWPAHAIYEEDVVETVTLPRNRARHTVEYHKWMSTSAPYNNRLVVIVNGKMLREQTAVNGRLDLYDPTTNTVYLAPAPNHSPDEPQSNSVVAEVQSLLSQPNVTVNPNAMLDGARAIELSFDRGRFSYWISPAPIDRCRSRTAGSRGSVATRSCVSSLGPRPRPACCRRRHSIPTPPSIAAPPITQRPSGG